MAAVEKRVFVVTSVAISGNLVSSTAGSGYDMILTDQRFIFTNRRIAEAGFAADSEGMATQYSFTQDLETLASKEGSLCLPFTDLKRVQITNEGKSSCRLSIEYMDRKGKKQNLSVECQFERDCRGTRYKYPDYTKDSNVVSAAYSRDCADFLQSIRTVLRLSLPPRVPMDFRTYAKAQTDDGTEHLDTPSMFSRRFPKYQLRMASEWGLLLLGHRMNADYSVESLEVFDKRVLSQTPEEHLNELKAMDDQSLGHMWWGYMVFGNYFAEVIIRNLGGRWRYPSRILVFFCLWAGYISPAYRHWYVVVGKQKVPVFEIMRRRAEMGANQVSLVRIYSEIKNGTFDLKKLTRSD